VDGLRFSEHTSENGSWRVASFAPRGRLAPYVSVFNAYEEHETAFRRRRELPDGSAVLIFNLGKPLQVEHPVGVTQSFGEGQGFFSGASTTYVVTETDGAQTGAQIKFSLHGARLFLGRPLGEFGDALVEPSEVLGRVSIELEERIAGVRSEADRVRLLAQVVEQRLHSNVAIAPGLAFAFKRLDRANVRIGDIAREIGMGRERFSKAFRHEFGLPPKTFARVRRFARSLRARELEPSIDGACLAAQCGYVDQAHMIHDFQEFAGGAPSAIWRRQLPDAGGFVD
jgi:AraC-like DNA-binding protein